MVLGPGLGQSHWSERLFDASIETGKVRVLDADGLNWLAKKPCYSDQWVLTPHPGEAARLLNCSVAEIQQDRRAAARDVVGKYGGVCVLKGPGTLVVDHAGKVGVCNQGNAGMATAGMGDVLSGIIGSLVGQGFTNCDAARIGVWLHSNCADRQAGNLGMRSLMAGDVINALPEQLEAVSH